MDTDPTGPRGATNRLRAEGITLGYDGQIVVDDLSFAVPAGEITVIIGPNACGKSTLLRALARLLRPSGGQVVLDGEDIHRLATKEVARRLGLLPQSPISPEGILVVDLVSRGRTPHQRLFQQWSDEDEAAVRNALEATNTRDLADRTVDQLSGGQRQRVWIAMAIAQQTDLLLLDEPTTFLDIAHQIDVLDLIDQLNREQGRTVVVVLHDLNLACRYANNLVAMRDGQIVASGPPDEVITVDSVREVFGMDCVITSDPVSHTPLVVPIGARRSPTANGDGPGEQAGSVTATSLTATPRTAASPAAAIALSPEVRDQVELTLEHVNGNHADTVLFITRHLGAVPSVTDAEAVDVDTEGVDVRVVADGQTTSTRLRFASPVSTAPDVQGELLGMIATARQTVGEAEPPTSLEVELATTGDLATRISSVVEVSNLSPNLRRIILQGGLEDWQPLGGDDFAFLFVPRSAGDTSIVDGFSMAAWREMAEDEQPFGAYYTIRRHDPETATLELWVVLHGHDSGVGGWAARAEPGDPVALWGPRSFFRPSDDPSWHHVFVADESGLAAVGAIVDTLDAATPVTVIAETIDAGHEIVISDRPGVEIQWLHRGETTPGESAGFIDRVKALGLDPSATVAFGAGESRQVTAVRGYLRRELGMAADRVFMTGYWRR